MRASIQRTFSAAVLTQLHPRSEITIALHILSQDGSVLATCINATTLALIDAGVPMTDYVCATTSAATATGAGESTDGGESPGDPLLDVNGIEEQDLPTMTVATLGATEKVMLLQLESKVHFGLVEGMMALAIDGCARLRGMLDGTVRAHGEGVLAARQGGL